MAEIQASFIPKKDIKKSARGRGGFSVNIFLLIAVIIFLTSIFASIGVYLWQQQVVAQKQEALDTLEKNKDNYGLEAIQDFIILSNRLQAADALLSSHVSVAKIFQLLEEETLTEVVVSDFSFSSVDDLVTVAARGRAPTYEHVAVQSQVYGENRNIKDLILSDVDQNRESGVSFNIAFSIDKSYLYLR